MDTRSGKAARPLTGGAGLHRNVDHGPVGPIHRLSDALHPLNAAADPMANAKAPGYHQNLAHEPHEPSGHWQ